MRHLGIPVLVLFAMALAAAPASAEAVQIPIKNTDGENLLNRDVIVNGVAGDIDPGQEGADATRKSYITQAAANAVCANDPDGLQNNGIYPATNKHPKVDLPYNNNNNGKNVRTLGPNTSALNTITVPTPKRHYSAIHVFGASTTNVSNVDVQLNYTDGTNTLKSVTFWDWFDDDPDSGYLLDENTDRAKGNGTECFDDDAANIYGFRVAADATKKIKSVTLTRTDAASSYSMLFGLTGKVAAT